MTTSDEEQSQADVRGILHRDVGHDRSSLANLEQSGGAARNREGMVIGSL